MSHAGRMLIDLRPVVSSVATLAACITLYLLAWLLSRARSRSTFKASHTYLSRLLSMEFRDGLVLVWLLYDTAIHTVVILGFLVSTTPSLRDLGLRLPVETAAGKAPIHIWVIWQSIRPQDGYLGLVPTFARWSEVGAVVAGACSAVQWLRIAGGRHQWLIALAVIELFLVLRGFFHFKPESLARQPMSDRGAAFWRWQTFFLFNVLWVLVPCGLIWRSVQALREKMEGMRLHDELERRAIISKDFTKELDVSS